MTSRLANSIGWALVPVLIFLAGATCGPLSRASAQSAAQPSSSDGGDEEIVAYRSFTQADGLPHSTVQVLAQAPDGQLWIGTSAGLAVYDGHRIQSAPLPDSLENRFVCDILPHESGTVWLSVHDRALVALRNGHVERVVSLLCGGNIDPAAAGGAGSRHDGPRPAPSAARPHRGSARHDGRHLSAHCRSGRQHPRGAGGDGATAGPERRVRSGPEVRRIVGPTSPMHPGSVSPIRLPSHGLSKWQSSFERKRLVRMLLHKKRCSQANPWNKIARSMHHSLQDPQDQAVGFVLDADQLGHEIYRILDWADEHFRSYSVDQADGRVYVRSDAIEDEAALHTEPLSVDGHAPASDSSRNGEGDGGRAEPIGM